MGPKPGRRRLSAGALLLLMGIYAAISGIVYTVNGVLAGVLYLAVLGLWGVMLPAQQVRPIGMAPSVAPIVLSLNQSALNLGIAGGAAAGGLVLQVNSTANIGWFGSASELAALTVLLSGVRPEAHSLRQADPVSGSPWLEHRTHAGQGVAPEF